MRLIAMIFGGILTGFTAILLWNFGIPNFHPLIVFNTLLTFGFILLLMVIAAYELAKREICFTTVKEGTAKAVMRGQTFSHFIMLWSGHRINDPRRFDYDQTKPAWEVLDVPGQPNAHPSPYAWWQIHWRLIARVTGIYWFGLSPLYQVYRYEFDWTEQKIGDDGQPCPWHRNEWTDYIYVKAFPYWTKLREAEDKENIPLDLDYLNRVEINNPYKALFRIDDWLDQGTADSNNRAKVYVGEHSFNEIKKEREADGTKMSGLTLAVSSINANLLTSPDQSGAPMQYGMTIVGTSMVSVTTAGMVKEQAEKALAAEELAKLNARGVAAAAEGYAEAERAKARGDADAARERAGGEADAIAKVYDKVLSYGDAGLVLRELDTLKAAASSPGSNTIWANDPLGGVGSWFKGLTITPTKPPTPPTTVNPAQP